MSESIDVRTATNWDRAPKDGSLINVEFSGGDVIQTRWDPDLRHWQEPRSGGDLVAMHQERHDPPQDWWPVI